MINWLQTSNTRHPLPVRFSIAPTAATWIALIFGFATVAASAPTVISATLSAVESKLLASDGSAGDWLGFDVAVDGDYAVATAVFDDPLCCGGGGSAYVFERLGGAWVQAAKLQTTAPGRESDEQHFGRSVSISGDTVVVGAPLGHGGAAYVYRRNGGGWPLETRLDPIPFDTDWDLLYGASVSIDGNTIVVGSTLARFGAGAAYVYERSGTVWNQTKRLVPVGTRSFGFLVAVSGDDIAVGTGDETVLIFQRDLGGAGNWGQRTEVVASDGAANDGFGERLEIGGDVLVVGASGNDDAGADSGSAYVFERNAGGPDNWGQTAKLLPADLATEDFFGWDVAISFNTIAIASPGDDDNGDLSGSAYLFRYDGATWSEDAKLLATGGAAWDFFGESISLSDNTVIVGVDGDGDNGFEAGAAWIYEIENTSGGDDVTVDFPNTGTGTSVSLTFDHVSGAGTTTLAATDVGPSPPLGFKLGVPPIYYDITTSATFDGMVTVCIDYSGVTFDGPETALDLLHFEGPPVDDWVDITTSLDTDLHLICGRTSSFSFFIIAEPGFDVEIDIKPGSYPNSINLGSNGSVPVAILGSAAFDASWVDPATITLAAAAVRFKGNGTPMASFEDVNGDSITDLVVHVSTSALELQLIDTQVVLKGSTYQGTPISGTDTVRIVSR